MTYRYRSPISMPMVVGNYLIQELTDPDYISDEDNIDFNTDANKRRVHLAWTLDFADRAKRSPKGRNLWLVSFAGTPMAVADVDSTSENIRPGCIISVAWASGASLPKWGIDDVHMRVFALVDVDFAPGLVAEDMLERIKMTLNSVDGREIWRLSHLPGFTTSDGKLTYNWLEPGPPDLARAAFGDMMVGSDLVPKRRWVANLIPLLYRVYKRSDESDKYMTQPDGTVRINPNATKPDIDTITGTTSSTRHADFKYVHIANWASTVLDGNTVQQVVGGTPETSYTAFSIDFSMYLELVHPDVLGYRKPFVDTLTP